MAYTVQWYVDQQILLCRYWGEQTEEDTRASLQEMGEMLGASSYPLIHIISDVSGVETPLPFLKLLNILRTQNLPEQAGWTILVGEKNAIVKFVAGAASSIIAQRTRSKETLEEALAYLKEVDQTIQWDQVKK